MSKETIQAVRDCAAMAEVLRLQILVGSQGAMTPASACREIINAIKRVWPEAFADELEKKVPELVSNRELPGCICRAQGVEPSCPVHGIR